MKNLMYATIVSTFAGLALAEASIPSGGYDSPTDCRVNAFVTTKWGQTTDNGRENGNKCFNYYISNWSSLFPEETTRDYAGCVAVAIGQVMRYWAWDGSSASPYVADCQFTSDGITVTTESRSTMGGPYDWANMPDNPKNGTTEAQRKAVGRLMYDIAVASGSTFTPTGTFVAVSTTRKRLGGEPFRYASAEDVRFNEQNCPYSEDLLKKMVLPNLDIGAPVVLATVSDDGQEHEIVVDGYGYAGDGSLMLHICNGAWGSGDGWYYPSEGFQNNGVAYPTIQECIFNIFPDKTGSVASGRVLDASRRTVAGATVSVYSNGTLVATATSTANGIYGFVLAPGTYAVRATSGVYVSDPISLVVGQTESRQFLEDTPTIESYTDPRNSPVIGNSYGNDIMLPGEYDEAAATPTFTPNGGEISGLTAITLACSTPGAIIRYTLDGSDPTVASPVYTNAISISDSVTVKAIAFARNMNPSIMTSANFTYKNSSVMVGDDRSAPMMIAGTNISKNVNNYIKYTHIPFNQQNGDPIVDAGNYAFFGTNSYTESHSAWLRWTASGTGKVNLRASVVGPGELGYNYDTDGNWSGMLESWVPEYGTCMVVYDESDLSNAIARFESSWYSYKENNVTKYRLIYYEVAQTEFNAVQGKTYLIQCECPYDLKTDYIDQFYFGGPYFWQYGTDWIMTAFNSANSYLTFSLSADLVTTPPAAPKMTVPTMANAKVVVTANSKTVLSAPGKVDLADNVNYTITYTANSGYQFSDGKTVWSAIVRDDTGADFSAAELDGYPVTGPESIAWHRPTSDGESVTQALIADGFSGTVTQEVTTVAAFDAFIGYLSGATEAEDENDLTQGEKINAYLCYRLESESVPTVALAQKDVAIAAMEKQDDGSLNIELAIAGVKPGESVSEATIKSVVRAYGGTSPNALSKDDVELFGIGIFEGRVMVNVIPAGSIEENPPVFFTRLEVIK